MFFIIGGEDKKKQAAAAMECVPEDIYILLTQKRHIVLIKAKHLKETINLENYITIENELEYFQL